MEEDMEDGLGSGPRKTVRERGRDRDRKKALHTPPGRTIWTVTCPVFNNKQKLTQESQDRIPYTGILLSLKQKGTLTYALRDQS